METCVAFQFIGRGLVAALSALLLLIPQVRAVEAYIRDQIAPLLEYVPVTPCKRPGGKLRTAQKNRGKAKTLPLFLKRHATLR
jgi:hypothetical protein